MNYGLRHGTHQVLTSGSSSSASSAFADGSEYIRVASTIATYIQIAVSPTAAATTAYLPADDVEYIKVSEGEKIAVLRVGGSDGKVSVTELTQ
jgi:hypothetical protein